MSVAVALRIPDSHYNPQTGRFLSEDPIRFSSGDLNLYRYVENNPTIYTDPDGKNPILIAVGIGAVVGGIAGAVGNIIAETNPTPETVGNAAIGGAVGGVVAVGLAGAAIVTGGGSLTVTGGVCSALGGLAVGTGTNLLLTSEAQPGKAQNKSTRR